MSLSLQEDVRTGCGNRWREVLAPQQLAGLWGTPRIALMSQGLEDPAQISLADCLTLGFSILVSLSGVGQLCSVINDRHAVVAHIKYIAALNRCVENPEKCRSDPAPLR